MANKSKMPFPLLRGFVTFGGDKNVSSDYGLELAPGNPVIGKDFYGDNGDSQDSSEMNLKKRRMMLNQALMKNKKQGE